MAIIYTYGYDSNINGEDALLGTDSNGRKTKQFKISDLTEYISENIGVVSGVNSITTTDSAFISSTPNTPTDGNVTITSTLSATGTPDATTYLRGDNTWATIPVDPDNYVDSISFNTGSGDLTLGRTGVLSDLVQNLDGRYALSSDNVIGSGTTNYLTVWQDVNEIGSGFLQSETVGVDDGVLYFGPDANTGVGIVFTKQVGSEQIRIGINNNSKLGVNTTGAFAEDLVVNEINITDGILATDGTPGAAGAVLYKPTADTLKWVPPSLIEIVPTLVTATPGGFLNLTDGDDFLYIGWSGGSGVFDVNLPNASGSPFKNIRFVCDGTVSANDKVHVNAVGSDTVDGGAFYEMNKPYNGVQVWSDGTQWIVIQAKST